MLKITTMDIFHQFQQNLKKKPLKLPNPWKVDFNNIFKNLEIGVIDEEIPQFKTKK